MSLSDRTPGGAQTRSKMHAVFGGPPFPQTLRWSLGAYTGGEEEGLRYIDWMSALASVGLGHCYGPVDTAVERAMATGTSLSLPSRLEYEVADLLCDTLKWPDQVRFVKTGSEATAAAMMIARRATGRKKIISIGYHGWHEAHLPSENLVDVPWGRMTAAAMMIDSTCAAVLVEPMRDSDTIPKGDPVKKYLEILQDRAKECGALFILDEMVTGFRWAIGGASEYFGITPDLACYGKAMGNGYPIACVVGSCKLMKHAHDVSSTYGGECVGLAAARATIEVYRREHVIEWLWEVGRGLQAGCPSLTGYPVHPVFKVGGDWTTSERAIPIVQYAAKNGVLLHPAGLNPTYSHSSADIARTIEVINEAVAHASAAGVDAPAA